VIRLLDTNHAIAYLNGDARLLPHLAPSQSAGDTFALTTTVLGELYYGALASERVDENMANLRAFADSTVVHEFDATAAAEFGQIKAELRKQGKPIPTADAQIAAVARLHGFTVLTDDEHFQYVQGITVENWLA